jgi:transcriptional regulator with XRE-family HTH domain
LENFHPFSNRFWGQLLDIVHRTVVVKFSHSQRFSPRKLIPVNLKTTGDYLLLKRIKADLSQQELAVKSGVTVRKVKAWEHDQSIPTEANTAWIHLDLNTAPLSEQTVYPWITEQLQTKLPSTIPELDFETLEVLEKLYGPELKKLKKGALSLLEANSQEYKSRIADEIIRLQNDPLKTVIAMERFLCTGREKLLIVVLDNCDKRGRDEQLNPRCAVW